METPGITVKPIKLISGYSPFYETFFDSIGVPKRNLVHELNKGWTVGKSSYSMKDPRSVALEAVKKRPQ